MPARRCWPACRQQRADVFINLGDTTASDTGLAGYFDKVVVTVDGVATTFDFEVPVAVKDACKDGG